MSADVGQRNNRALLNQLRIGCPTVSPRVWCWVSIATCCLGVWPSARQNCCGYVGKRCFGLSELCCALTRPRTPDSAATSPAMTSSRSRRSVGLARSQAG